MSETSDPINSMPLTRCRALAALGVAVATLLVGAGCASSSNTKGSSKLEAFDQAGATEEATDGESYALVVGIESFESSEFDDLEFAAADARAMADALSHFDEVIELTDPEETDRGDLFEALHRLSELADDPRDVAFVYVSTHGTLDQKPGGPLERYLVTRDTKLDVVSTTGLRVKDLLDRMRDFGSKRTALVLATCHSGSGKSRLSDALSEALANRKSADLLPLRRVSEATVMLSASAFEEPAREDASLGHDVYTYFFLEALEHGDRDGNGAVTISEAHDYARGRTYAYTDGAQRPTAWSNILGKDPIVLAGEPSGKGKPLVYSYARSADGLELDVDGETKGTLPGGVALEPGRHEVAVRDGRSDETLWEGEIKLNSGQRLEVAELIPPESSIDIQTEGGGWLAFGGDVRREYMPALWQFGGRLSVVREPWRNSLFEVRAVALRGGGRQTTFESAIPFVLRGGHVQVGGGGVWALGSGFELQVGGDLGVLWASRRFETSSYRHTERMRGTTAAAFGGLAWRFADWGRLGARVDVGTLRAPFGDQSGFYPYGAASIGAGVGF